MPQVFLVTFSGINDCNGRKALLIDTEQSGRTTSKFSSYGDSASVGGAIAPNLNLIERLWRFTKRQAAYGKYYPSFADFRAAIQNVLEGIPTKHASDLKSLMTLNFQVFDDVSLLAA